MKKNFSKELISVVFKDYSCLFRVINGKDMFIYYNLFNSVVLFRLTPSSSMATIKSMSPEEHQTSKEEFWEKVCM